MSASRYHPASLSDAWSPPVSVSEGSRIHHPALSVGDDGELHLVWCSGNAIMHTFCQDGVWQQAQRVSGGIQPSIAHDGEGILHLAFCNNYSGRYEIYHCTWNGAYWTLPLNVSLTPGASYQPQMLIDPTGQRHLVWEDHSPGYPIIYHAWHRTGWHWSHAPVPHAAGWRPAAGFGADGSLYVAHRTGREGHGLGDIYCAARQGDTWMAPLRISTGDHAGGGVALRVDETGMAHAIWRERRPDQDVILYACGRGHRWRLPQAISPALDRGGWPALAIVGSRQVHALWDYVEVLEWSLSTPNFTGWEAVELAAAENYRICEPVVAGDRDGRLHSVWMCHKPNANSVVRYAVRQPALTFKTYLPRV